MNSSLVVPVDDSHRSLDALIAGRSLAEQMGLTLHLVSVVARDEDKDSREQAIRGALDGEVAEVSVLVDHSPADALLQALSSGKGNVCCIATHARGAVSEMVLGSVARRIVQEYAGPVVVVGPKHARKWAAPVRTVVVCVDGSPLSEQALMPAAKCAAWLKASLQLVQVLDPETTQIPSDGDSAEWVYLHRLADQLRRDKGISAEWEVLHGKHAAEAITAHVDSQPGSLVVLSSHGRSGFNRLVMGSVAQNIVRESGSPVWIIRAQ
ncbi:MAG: universal stress protein [Rhodocyclaceae bacterium]|jgi:nucleotide-binding universal stress UspA family protein|nr:universal stress protein [Rhodocyclaceae bacterium]MCL4757732.1 universal stress protein [Rhodocyclaceae bacterium]